MKVKLRIWFILFCLTATIAGHGAAAYAQDQAAPQAQAGSSSQPKEAAKEEGGNDQFRHATNVEAVAKMLHMSTESTAQLFEWINSGILIIAILFFIAKILPKAMRGRSELIQKKLDEARVATAGATERLGAIEAKLAKIDEDIDVLRKQSESAALEDEKRIKQSLEDERHRIVKSAEQEIDSAGAAAKRDLKRFAAELAIENASKRIELTYESDKALVERFGHDLTSQFGKGGRN